MRKVLIFILLVVLVAGAWLAYAALAPVAPGQEFVMLPPGSSVRQIAARLQQAGVIRSARAFLLLHTATGGASLKAGEYRFSQAATARQVHDRIARGDIYFHSVAIPEGYNLWDIAGVFEQSGLATKEEFLNLARTEVALIADLDPQARSLEGYLFPDTYRFTRTQNLRDMLGTMVKRFRQEAQAIGLNRDFHRVVTMASIVEKETSVPTERPVVAGVFYNRLNLRIGLATDPSVIYAALLGGRWDGVIHVSDLQYDSPYNTYRYSGLPPGPIANPGRNSLTAAMTPALTQYLYFVADNRGGHKFARTLEEHNRNVAEYRRGLGAGSR